MSAENPRTVLKDIDVQEELRKLHNDLTNSGLKFRQTVEDLGLYSQTVEMRKFGDIIIKRNIIVGSWSFDVYYGRKFPFRDRNCPTYSKVVGWLFGEKDQLRRKGLFGVEVVKEINPNFWKVKLFEREENPWNELDIEANQDFANCLHLGMSCASEDNKFFEAPAEEPLGTAETISLLGEDDIPYLSMLREFTGDHFRFKSSVKYGRGGSSSGVLVLNDSVKMEIKAYGPKQKIVRDYQDEMVTIQRKLLESFPDQIDAVALARKYFRYIIEVTDQATRDLNAVTVDSLSAS